jgi:hypothetical protein
LEKANESSHCSQYLSSKCSDVETEVIQPHETIIGLFSKNGNVDHWRKFLEIKSTGLCGYVASMVSVKETLKCTPCLALQRKSATRKLGHSRQEFTWRGLHGFFGVVQGTISQLANGY